MPMPETIRAPVENGGAMPPTRVLLMAGPHADSLACARLLKASGCDVQSCSNYIELLLFLEHESFQLVVIFERSNSQEQWPDLVQRIAEAERGIPVMVLNQGRDAMRPLKNLLTGGTSH